MVAIASTRSGSRESRAAETVFLVNLKGAMYTGATSGDGILKEVFMRAFLCGLLIVSLALVGCAGGGAKNDTIKIG
jgi:hypothetical protein